MTLLGIDPYLSDWLDLILRWLHVIAGIVWIGTSFYFVALDNHLLPPKREEDAGEGVGGESWEVHGGGFYLIQKYRVAPRTLPEPLHWFKWEAYTTWLSGFALMVVVFYLDADVYLVDRGVADLGEWAAVGISVGLLAVAWIVYDVLCRLLGARDLAIGAGLVGLVALTSWGTGELFAPRAAWLQVGAMLGTIMAANVLFVIIPAHWELVRAKQAGREPDPLPGVKAKQRSVHNNYLTLPVLVAMLGGHLAFLYGRDYGWLILLFLMVVGAWIRLFFNLRHAGTTAWGIPATAAVAVAVLAFAIRPGESSPDGGGADPVPFAAVRPIVAQHCATCHSAQPTDRTFTTAPKGVELDTPEQIAAQAEAIERVAVTTQVMPLGNRTEMTDGERDLLGRWIRQGAKIE